MPLFIVAPDTPGVNIYVIFAQDSGRGAAAGGSAGVSRERLRESWRRRGAPRNAGGSRGRLRESLRQGDGAELERQRDRQLGRSHSGPVLVSACRHDRVHLTPRCRHSNLYR